MMKFLSNFVNEHKSELGLVCTNILVYQFYPNYKRNYTTKSAFPLVISSSIIGATLPLINGNETTPRTWIIRCLLGISVIYCHKLGADFNAITSKSCENVGQKIVDIRKKVDKLRTKVEEWNGSKSSKKYIYFEESFLGLLDNLDEITSVEDSIKQDKRQTIKYIYNCLDILDGRIVE